ncbi:MAG: DEAD/DEAH box helicase [Acidimicrobiales bacterium]
MRQGAPDADPAHLVPPLGTAHDAIRTAFTTSLGFALDPFQVRALDALDAGRSVLVAAPTGSGKTVVGEYALARALAEGAKAFYTTPLKALSNQKYGDLVRRHGADQVGLLTGDNAINGDAPLVVMTTEVLRNMIYARSAALGGLRYVVLDEVHYLENAWRGPVWEEVIIHTPPEVDLVCLSATVSNAEEFADWLQTVRGRAEAIIEERRPVELTHLYLVGDRSTDQLRMLPTFVDDEPNAEASSLDGNTGREQRPRSRRERSRMYAPRRAEVVEVLGQRSMLPAIFFIFSRAACDDAVRGCRAAGLRLTSPAERAEIRAIAESRVGAIGDADLEILRYGEWLDGLESGIAAHHAGLVPPFKEAVEACFAAGLVKVVFATETLALGINMPARTVVMEKLSKFTGERHEFLKPGEYTQLTGRAGRRGIDSVGYAVVLWSPFVPFEQVAGLASTRTYALTSAFRPTYNMAANLVRRYSPDRAHHLLNLSFAQYRADADVVRLEAQLARQRANAQALRARAACDRGDVEEYRSLATAARVAGRMRASHRGEIEEGLARIKPGDVVVVPGGPGGGRIAVVSTARRAGGELRLAGARPDGTRVMLTSRDFVAVPRSLAHVALPEPYRPHARSYLKEVAALLRTARLRTDVEGQPIRRPKATRAMGLAEAAESHPVASCPDLRAHLRAAERAERLEEEALRLEHSVRGRTASLARQFDRVLRVLEGWGYVEGWHLTEAGERLARLYHECDLLIAEVLGSGLLEGLDPASVAGLASTFTYSARGPEGTGVGSWFPSRRANERWVAIEGLARDLNLVEEQTGLPLTRSPDAGFVASAHAWAAGQDLGHVIVDSEMSGGDFVRNVKQLVDLLRQLGDLAPDPGTARACRVAAEEVFRGVVSASSVVSVAR